MNNLMITTAKKDFSNQLPVGSHIVTVESILQTSAKAKGGEWNDETPQIELKYKNETGSIKQWLNLQGFKKYGELSAKEIASNKFTRASSENGDEDYAINKATGMRVEDPARTEKCMEIIAQVAGDIVGSAGEDVNFFDLVGSEVGIVVRAKGTSTEVHYTCDPARIVSADEVTV
jgi:hypothetical protein